MRRRPTPAHGANAAFRSMGCGRTAPRPKTWRTCTAWTNASRSLDSIRAPTWWSGSCGRWQRASGVPGNVCWVEVTWVTGRWPSSPRAEMARRGGLGGQGADAGDRVACGASDDAAAGQRGRVFSDPDTVRDVIDNSNRDGDRPARRACRSGGGQDFFAAGTVFLATPPGASIRPGPRALLRKPGKTLPVLH